MLKGSRIAVVLPAYNAEQTLRDTVRAVDRGLVDDLILVDDASHDHTVEVARELGLFVHEHPKNRGYGGNQKSCYSLALRRGADVVVMLHPDNQYDPRLIPALVAMIDSGNYDLVLGSRILGNGALAGGMPVVKYVANRLLTFIQNLLVGQKLSEYHTGYRAFTRRLLETLPLEENDDDFIFDNQMLVQAIAMDFRIGEVSCPTRYFDEASSISLGRSCVYGLGVLRVSLRYFLHRLGWKSARRFGEAGRKLLLQSSDARPTAPPGAP
ncbi:MAG: glycosyltransferase family 2 protein [Planctomycetes bacterium]|nr:glycosyltransferase family 2 protein [Planctomycetota bacterium]